MHMERAPKEGFHDQDTEKITVKHKRPKNQREILTEVNPEQDDKSADVVDISPEIDTRKSERFFAGEIEPGTMIETTGFFIDPDIGLKEGKRDTYIMDGLVGKGGMGAVFLGRKDTGIEDEHGEPLYGEPVAIKVLYGTELSDEQLALFKREMVSHMTAAEISPYVVPVINFVDMTIPGTHDTRTAIIMKYAEDGDLYDLSVSLEKRDETHLISSDAFVGNMCLEISKALAAMHHMGIAHRDIKLGNIFVNLKEFSIQMGDFGIAKAYDDAVKDMDGDEMYYKNKIKSPAKRNILGKNLTSSGGIKGTLSHMTPESLRNGEVGNGVASDLYALGVVLFELRTGGEEPGDSSDIMKKALLQPRSLREVIGDEYTPQLLDPLIEQLVRYDPDDRKQVTIEGVVYDIDTAEHVRDTMKAIIEKHHLNLKGDEFVHLIGETKKEGSDDELEETGSLPAYKIEPTIEPTDDLEPTAKWNRAA